MEVKLSRQEEAVHGKWHLNLVVMRMRYVTNPDEIIVTPENCGIGCWWLNLRARRWVVRDILEVGMNEDWIRQQLLRLDELIIWMGALENRPAIRIPRAFLEAFDEFEEWTR